MLLPVRRPIDYLRMMIIDKEPLTEDKILIHKRNNYYYNKTFYYNRTKTKEIQKITVPDELDILIKNYINDRISGCLLLDNNNKQYNSSNLSIHIMRIFNKIYDISISAVESVVASFVPLPPQATNVVAIAKIAITFFILLFFVCLFKLCYSLT